LIQIKVRLGPGRHLHGRADQTPIREPENRPMTHAPAPNPAAPFAAAAAMAEGLIEMQRHLIEFTARRLRDDIETAQQMAACRDAPKLMALTQGFCAKAVSDYTEEAQTLMKMGGDVAAGAAAKAQARA
jgi:hypothetical protein